MVKYKYYFYITDFLKGDKIMKCPRYIEEYSNTNRKMRRMIFCGVATASLATVAYMGVKKVLKMIDDEVLYDEDKIEKTDQEKDRMKFYEDEFIRQEKEEQEELEKAVEEFNSKRLTRESCPHCRRKKA